MVACVLIRAIRLRSPLQFAHFSSMLKVRRKSSFQGMDLDLDLRFTGGVASAGVCSSCVSAGKGDVAVAFAAVGMIRERKALCEDSTPR